eukprot:16208392-Heterocapsa_arctica.AAC.1
MWRTPGAGYWRGRSGKMFPDQARQGSHPEVRSSEAATRMNRAITRRQRETPPWLSTRSSRCCVKR